MMHESEIIYDWIGSPSDCKSTIDKLIQEKAEAIKIAQIALTAIETIYELAQNCYDCPSFEIAKQCRDELHGFKVVAMMKVRK